MIREKHVRMIIRADGSCSVDAVNFTDAGCLKATEQITQALAGVTVGEHHKPEARLPMQREQGRQEAMR